MYSAIIIAVGNDPQILVYTWLTYITINKYAYIKLYKRINDQLRDISYSLLCKYCQ